MANWTRHVAAIGWAAAAPLIAAAQPAPAPEAVDAAPAEQVVLEADNVYEIASENSIVAEGNVEALYDGRILRADKLIYNKTTDKVRASGNVIGSATAGGLVGNYSSSSNVATDTGIQNSHASGNVEAPIYAGGLVGQFYSYGGIEDSYATGNVLGTGSTPRWPRAQGCASTAPWWVSARPA